MFATYQPLSLIDQQTDLTDETARETSCYQRRKIRCFIGVVGEARDYSIRFVGKFDEKISICLPTRQSR